MPIPGNTLGAWLTAAVLTRREGDLLEHVQTYTHTNHTQHTRAHMHTHLPGAKILRLSAYRALHKDRQTEDCHQSAE